MDSRKDYFGKTIEVGDYILRPCFSTMKKHKVLHITERGSLLVDGHKKWDIELRKTVDSNIYLDTYSWPDSRLINLTKNNLV